MDLPDFYAGKELTAEDLQALVEWLRAHEISVLPGGGLIAVQHGGGLALAAADTDAGDWFKLMSHVSGNHYKIRRQVDDPAGTWADAEAFNVDGYEANGVSTLPNGLVIWAEPAISGTGSRLKFVKGLCP